MPSLAPRACKTTQATCASIPAPAKGSFTPGQACGGSLGRAHPQREGGSAEAGEAGREGDVQGGRCPPSPPTLSTAACTRPPAPTRRPSGAAEASAQPGLTSSQRGRSPDPRGVVRGEGGAGWRRSLRGPGPGSAAQPHLPADVAAFRDAARRRRRRREMREVAQRDKPRPVGGAGQSLEAG